MVFCDRDKYRLLHVWMGVGFYELLKLISTHWDRSWPLPGRSEQDSGRPARVSNQTLPELKPKFINAKPALLIPQVVKSRLESYSAILIFACKWLDCLGGTVCHAKWFLFLR